ncbi:hypothetical protein BN946_scf184999.g41 [Trametes cinnabarina]|uniref:Uncharacterized protein n=1 Tax=Pycnoporus cinnabarinus TaxID=5643 RepID=A0A060S7R7_PYCCI|nr:hypothetical protein BN946_scf184999.g41 [Trametes cinnabarina]
MDNTSTLDCISKEFGISFSEKRHWLDIRRSISRTWQATRKSPRHSRGLLPSQDNSPTNTLSERWRLPFELLEQIIDHLYNVPASLRSCALEKNFVKFVLLIVQNAHLASHVRDLYFEAGGDAFGDLQRQPSTVVRVFALVIAPRLPNVVRLTMKDVPINQDVVEMLSPMFPLLQTLSLFDCWFNSHSNFETLVQHHPQVHTMRCGRLCSLHGADSDSPTSGARSLNLRALKVTEAYSPTPLTMMPWLVSHVHPELFTYTLYRLSQVAKLNQIIAAYASMRHLHVIFYHWRKGDTDEVNESPQVMALTPHHLPNITTLTLDAKLHSLPLVVHLLAQLDPPSFVRLQTVNIIAHIDLPDIERIADDAWAGMDKTLGALPALRAVNFTNSCQDPSHVDEGRASILARLPVLSVPPPPPLREVHQLFPGCVLPFQCLIIDLRSGIAETRRIQCRAKQVQHRSRRALGNDDGRTVQHLQREPFEFRAVLGEEQQRTRGGSAGPAIDEY